MQEGDTWAVIRFDPKGWVNHPASKMWRGYETSLAEYGVEVCDEWIRRDYHDTCRARILLLVPAADPSKERPPAPKPPWFGNEAFHASHRSNLMRKDPEWYNQPQFGWREMDTLPYIWPVQ